MTNKYSELHGHVSALAVSKERSGLLQFNRGMEKESLRIDANGHLAQTPHPLALGSALTHPRITTDFAEPLLEFITPVVTDADSLLAELDEIHRFTYANLEEEMLWVCSMPCILEGDEHIPVAQYGKSNIARMKSVYRLGLGHRYGRLMQTIAGIHYNFSLSESFWTWLHEREQSRESLQEFKTQRYFGLIRNFYRYSWLLVYLFGASPAICKSFVRNREHSLDPLTAGTLHLPYGTSLRMGDLGYQSSAQSGLDISYNCLEEYLSTLEQAISTPHSQYQKIGLRGKEGYRQLSTALLQIENEFYSSIRPKRVAASGEAPRRALGQRGVEYIEVRCLDLDPYEPVGISAETIAFVDCFLFFCLLHDSPWSDQQGRLEAKQNLSLIVNEGRKPGLELTRHGRARGLKEWGMELLEAMGDISTLLEDSGHNSGYTQSIFTQQEKLREPGLTPSARVLDDLVTEDIPFFHFAHAQAISQAQFFKQKPLPAGRTEYYHKLSKDSLIQQADIETADTLGFDQFLERYFSQ